MPSFVLKAKLECCERPKGAKGVDLWVFDALSVRIPDCPSLLYPVLEIPAISPKMPESQSLSRFWESQENSQADSLLSFKSGLQSFFEEQLDSPLKLAFYPEPYRHHFPTPSCRVDFAGGTSEGVPARSLFFRVPKVHCPLTAEVDYLRFWLDYEGSEIPLEALSAYFKEQSTSEFHELRVDRIVAELLSQFSLQRLTLTASYTEVSASDCILIRHKSVTS